MSDFQSEDIFNKKNALFERAFKSENNGHWIISFFVIISFPDLSITK